MNTVRFDRLATTLAAGGTRRGLVRLLTGLPLVRALAAVLGDDPAASAKDDDHGSSHRRQRRRARHRHRPGNDKGKDKSQGKKPCAAVGQKPRTRKRRGCCAGLRKDASGRCAAPTPGPATCTGLRPTTTSPTQGLQEAIDQAADGATLTLCAGTWALSAGVVIAKDLTLRGAGAGQSILDGGDAVRVLRIAADATVTLQDLTITNGRASNNSVSLPFFFIGPGIVNQGTLTLRGVDVTGNSTEFGGGGGVYNLFGTLTLATGSRVMGNDASSGGGIFNNSGAVTLQGGSSVSGNTATGQGGGINTEVGTLTLQAGSSVTGNTAGGPGGGIRRFSGTVTLDPGSSVTGNTPDNCDPDIGTCT